VTIARAVINDPAVIIADEPTAHLDSKLSREWMENVGRLKDDGKTVLIASHDSLVYEVYEGSLVDRIIHVRDGKIEEDAGRGSFLSHLNLGEQVARFAHGESMIYK
jgi:putative ABC transport system ATP-binding protein